jgi:menaquinone-dependent protoporphyrinogen oxidase
MSNKILIAYASRTGTTAGVAEAVGKTLAEQGAEVDVRAMKDVSNFYAYKAAVIGSAIQNRQWLPEALDFVRANRPALNGMPIAVFLVCMTLAMRQGNYRDQVARWLDPVRALVRPVSVGLFAGALDISKIPSRSDRLKVRLSTMFGVWTEGDHRDWEAIRSWANNLPPLLKL